MIMPHMIAQKKHGHNKFQGQGDCKVELVAPGGEALRHNSLDEPSSPALLPPEWANSSSSALAREKGAKLPRPRHPILISEKHSPVGERRSASGWGEGWSQIG